MFTWRKETLRGNDGSCQRPGERTQKLTLDDGTQVVTWKGLPAPGGTDAPRGDVPSPTLTLGW